MIFLFKRIHLPHRVLSCSIALVSLAGFALELPGASIRNHDKENLADLLELRGYMRIGKAIEFSVHNKQEKRSEWLRVNEEHEGYLIESYNPERNEIVIRYNNKVGTLPLQASKIADYVEPDSTAASTATDAPEGRPTAASPGLAPARVEGGTNRGVTLSGPRRGAGRAGSGRQGRRDVPGEAANFLPSGGRIARPPSPTAPDSEEPAPEEPGDSDSYWETMNSPPPLPSTAPPNYSPEE